MASGIHRSVTRGLSVLGWRVPALRRVAFRDGTLVDPRQPAEAAATRG